MNLDQYRGKAVLVTFIYDHCPDICPLMVGNLHTAQAQLGPEAQKLQIIAVSVDPRGDTPSTVKAFLREHRMTGRMEYLIGSRPELEKVWRDWSILSKATPTPKDPDLVEHSALVYGISASGRITTLYPHDFVPSQIVHDVPILASAVGGRHPSATARRSDRPHRRRCTDRDRFAQRHLESVRDRQASAPAADTCSGPAAGHARLPARQACRDQLLGKLVCPL